MEIPAMSPNSSAPTHYPGRDPDGQGDSAKAGGILGLLAGEMKGPQERQPGSWGWRLLLGLLLFLTAESTGILWGLQLALGTGGRGSLRGKKRGARVSA